MDTNNMGKCLGGKMLVLERVIKQKFIFIKNFAFP